MSSDLTQISPSHRRKFTGRARVTLTAVSLMSFLGGWNLIARLENQTAQAGSIPLKPPSLPTSTLPTPAAWPTVQPLAEIPPIPTLVPTRTTWPTTGAGLQSDQTGQEKFTGAPAPVTLAPLPALAPLPTLAPLPPLPALPPPPPPPAPAGGGGNNSGGS
jgi:hypothetical protein